MISRGIFILILIGYSASLIGQCPTSDFTLPASVCIDESFNVENNTTAGTTYEWDFCAGDLSQTPIASSLVTITGASTPRGIEIVKDGSNWYGFVTSRGNHKIIRLDFGSDLKKSTPAITDLGNPNDLLNGPEPIKMYQEDGRWYALVHNGGNNTLALLDFGADITSTPSCSIVLSDIGTLNSSLDLTISNGNLIAVLSKNSNDIVIVNFTNSITNIPGSGEIHETGTITGLVGGIIDLKLMHQCDQWVALAISYSSKSLYVLEFGTDLFTTPSLTKLGGSTPFSGDNPYRIEAEYDSGSFMGLITTQSGNFYRVDLGQNLTNIDIGVTPENLGKLSLLNVSFSMSLVKNNSEFNAFTLNASTNQFFRVDFPNECDVNQFESEAENPENLVYGESGTYYVDLTTTDVDNNIDRVTKELTITSSVAPDITFVNETVCQTSPIQFTSTSSSGSLTYTWDFGDASGSSDPNPSHSYATSGEYEVTLVVDDGTCSNFTSETILVYDEPVPDFTIPGGNICTNQNYIFTNTTPGDFDDLITYEWFLDGISVGTSEDLTITFTSGGTKELKLVASLPGCDVEIAKNLSNIKVGALPDFTFDDSCVGELVQFMNESTGSITDYNWDFGNGFTSILEDPQIQYTNSGEFLITLELTNTDGCVTNESRTITIHPLPAVNFEQELACEKLSTQFNDLTIIAVDNLSSWEWDFGDGSANVLIQNPTHVFGEFGNYNVKLIATSSFGCVDSLEQAVNVLQSPLADFEYNKLCEDVEINFIDQSEPLPSESIVQWAWNIGGAFSAVQNPAYTFNEPLDYNVALTVTSENLCTSTVSKTLNIPAQPEVTFSISDNCDNQIAILTDNTLPEDDTIIDWKWIYDEIIIGDLNQIPYEFEEGTYLIDLELITENGCSYQKQQEITIYKSPEASFTPSFDFGAPPLELSFNNTSSGAVTYSWDFNDGNTSVEESPGNTFVSVGDYTVQLVAVSAENCKDTTSTIIQVLDPLSDLALNSMSVININGQDKLSLAITNNGTVREENIKLSLDFGGELRLKEVINQTLNPGQSMTIQLDFSLTDSRIKYLCGEISSIYDLDDERLDDNSYCINFSNSQAIIEPPYPNPTNGDVSIDIILENSGLVNIEIVNSKGDLIDVYQQEISRGPNTLTLDMSGLKEGIYFISISALNEKKKYRIVLVD